jgi:signal transduction histidine kinase
VLYGAGAALTLDEFALWLHLEDVYWERTGRASIDAVFLFGAMVSAGVWGGPFWRAALRQLARLWRRGAAETAEAAAAATAAVAEAAAAAAEEAPALDFADPEPVPEPVLAKRPASESRSEP